MNLGKLAEHDGVLIRDYNGPNWFTPRGVYLKRKEIEKKGIPNLRNCKFVTLTIDQRLYGCRRTAYELGKDRLRRFMAKLRSVLGCRLPFAWKLEFHESGFAHWHLILVYRKKIPLELIKQFNDWWGLGRVNTKGIDQDGFEYLFKYVSKGAWSESNAEGINLPDWVLDYWRVDENGRKTSTIRFWQTGGGFHEVSGKPEVKELSDLEKCFEDQEEAEKEQKYSRVSYTLRTLIGIWSRKVTFFATDRMGQVRSSRQAVLMMPWAEFFQCMVHKLIDGKAALVDGIWVCRTEILESILSIWQMNQVKQIELRRSRLAME